MPEVYGLHSSVCYFDISCGCTCCHHANHFLRKSPAHMHPISGSASAVVTSLKCSDCPQHTCWVLQLELQRWYENCEMRTIVLSDDSGAGGLDPLWFPGGNQLQREGESYAWYPVAMKHLLLCWLVTCHPVTGVHLLISSGIKQATSCSKKLSHMHCTLRLSSIQCSFDLSFASHRQVCTC